MLANLWAIVADPQTISSADNAINGRIISMENRNTGERRHILGITLMAKPSSRYAVTLTPDKKHMAWWTVGNAAPLIPAVLADNKMHIVYSVVVERVNAQGEYETPTLSRACRLPNLMRHIKRQEEIGIVPGDVKFINPLGYLHKDVLIALALTGKSIAYSTNDAAGTKDAKSIMRQYAAAERELMERA